MSVNYHDTVRRNRMTSVIAALDANTSPDKNATLEITTSSPDQVLVTITCSRPSFALTNTSPDSAVSITLQGVSLSGTASATGTAAAARFKDGNGFVIIDGLTVGVGSENIVLNSASITNGQTVSITSGVITHG